MSALAAPSLRQAQVGVRKSLTDASSGPGGGPPHKGNNMDVVVKRASSKVAQNIAIGKHQLLADVPVALGGEDQGVEPHDLLAAALGSCTAMTVTMYARMKKIELDDIEVRVEHGEADGGYIFTRHIRYFGNLEPAQKERLTQIANRCPVHRYLSGQIRITTLAA